MQKGGDRPTALLPALSGGHLALILETVQSPPCGQHQAGLGKNWEVPSKHTASLSLSQAKSTLESPRHSFTKVVPSYGTAFHSLRPFYSSSNSSVKIHPAQGMPPCGDVQQVTVHYNILAKELEEGAAQVQF
ncbi:Metabotropic glutamate receptor 6 [Platysternon megacephalum]|uniref:Metabotropic glutamate receptor 6 n=1 Tax=Platysternon megacephalum TaxID=55544 RepID=A0A4D9DRK2_9SAUR|nr:Metabotropic glutamate receptor 6 [Platysternon megacephalum]